MGLLDKVWWWAHVTVTTESGATYLFRVFPGKTYLTITGSSLFDCQNSELEWVGRANGEFYGSVVVGQKMRIDHDGYSRLTSRVKAISLVENWPAGQNVREFTDCAVVMS